MKGEGEGGKERGEREKGERERETDWLPPVCTPTGDWTHNLGMCPDWESNHSLLVYGKIFQPTEPPSQGDVTCFLC